MRYFITLFIFALLGFSGPAQNVNKNIRFVPESEVPAPVLENQKMFFPGSFVTAWQLHQLDQLDRQNRVRYHAKYEKDGRPGYTATYLPSGLLVFNSKFITKENIPQEVLTEIDRQAADFEVKETNLITVYNPKRQFFMIKLLHGPQSQYLFFNSNGQKVEKENLPVGLWAVL